jgi:hypothetical protein
MIGADRRVPPVHEDLRGLKVFTGLPVLKVIRAIRVRLAREVREESVVR